MDKTILTFVSKCEGWKTAIKQLHWNSKNMSQHKLCDDIAERISDFQDQVSEVEQSISGNLPFNKLKAIDYKVIGLKPFVEDVISDAKTFLKKLEKMGENYVGMKSDCESFISDMQRNLYLVNFTLKEGMKKSIKNMLSERMYKNIPVADEEGNQSFDKMNGRQPKTAKARIARIYRIVEKYGINSRRYKDEHWQAVDDYASAIESLGCETNIWCDNGGYTDIDPYDGMPRSKEYNIEISYEDGMVIAGYIKCMACGTVDDPFSVYDTCMVLWPKPKRISESLSKKGKNEMGNRIRLTESDFHKVIEESVNKILKEMGNGTNGRNSLMERVVTNVNRPRPQVMYFTAEVEMDDEENEQSRFVELPFTCTVDYAPEEPEVNYGGHLWIDDIQLDMKNAQGLLSAEEGNWVVNEWIPNNEDYLEEIAQEQYMEDMQWNDYDYDDDRY